MPLWTFFGLRAGQATTSWPRRGEDTGQAGVLGMPRFDQERCDAACQACADVCLTGGVPPVLVTTAPVAGAQFLLMGDPAGHALPDALRDHVAIPQRMDGTLERLADLLVFRTDVAAAADP